MSTSLSSFQIPFLAVALSIATAQAHNEVLWKESFDSGLQNVAPSAVDGNESKPELLSEGVAGAGNFVRYAMSGTPSMEGVKIDFHEAPASRMLTVRGKVRGSGALMLSLRSKNGWAYSPPFTLREEWQEVSLSKVTHKEDTALGIYFHRPPKVFAAGTLDIKDVEVSAAPALQLEDMEVEPVRIEAADYAKSAKQIIATGESRGVGGKSPFVISSVPFPQTSREVAVYLRVRPAGPEDRYTLTSMRTGATQTIRQSIPEGEIAWQWVKFPSVLAEEAGEEISIQGWPQGSGGEEAIVEAIVFSTDLELEAEALDQV